MEFIAGMVVASLLLLGISRRPHRSRTTDPFPQASEGPHDPPPDFFAGD